MAPSPDREIPEDELEQMERMSAYLHERTGGTIRKQDRRAMQRDADKIKEKEKKEREEQMQKWINEAVRHTFEAGMETLEEVTKAAAVEASQSMLKRQADQMEETIMQNLDKRRTLLPHKDTAEDMTEEQKEKKMMQIKAKIEKDLSVEVKEKDLELAEWAQAVGRAPGIKAENIKGIMKTEGCVASYSGSKDKMIVKLVEHLLKQ